MNESTIKIEEIFITEKLSILLKASVTDSPVLFFNPHPLLLKNDVVGILGSKRPQSTLRTSKHLINM